MDMTEWRLVPVEPTEDMVANGFESRPDPHFSPQEEWEAYEKMSGCQQAAHRARLCWAAMLAAAPQAPVADAARSDELASMTRMFHAACADLGAINEALGLDPDDAGAEPILDAIAELKRERDQWADAGYAASTQQAARASEAGDAFPYQQTFNAIAAATTIEGGHIAISVRKFQEAFGSAQQAVTLTDEARDAARYRWLKEHGDVSVRDIFGGLSPYINDDLDTAIDAALQSHSEGEA